MTKWVGRKESDQLTCDMGCNSNVHSCHSAGCSKDIVSFSKSVGVGSNGGVGISFGAVSAEHPAMATLRSVTATTFQATAAW
jgi:hypothetical protein